MGEVVNGMPRYEAVDWKAGDIYIPARYMHFLHLSGVRNTMYTRERYLYYKSGVQAAQGVVWSEINWN